MNKALFLDRDGVINEEINYLHTIEDFRFIESIFDLCRFYRDHQFIIIVITNQAGIARGLYTEADLEVLNHWMIDQFLQRGIQIGKVYHCPHHPDFTGPCSCRKPNPGMIFQAAEEFDINLASSILIGDKESDLEAGFNAGILHCYNIQEIFTNKNNWPLPK